MRANETMVAPERLREQAAYCERLREWWRARGAAPTACVETYGCQQNEADSQRIAGMLERCGYALQAGAEDADVIVVNTCAVREHAEQRVYGNVGALVHGKRRRPSQKIFLCGCMMGQKRVVERIRESYRHVDGVFSPHHLWRLPELLWEAVSSGRRVFAVEDSPGVIAEGLPVERGAGNRAWVSVMYGCDNFCTYCIVPYVRGRERSRAPEAVLAEVEELAAQGYRDITLLGQNVNSYGKGPDGIGFPALLEKLAAVPGDFWLRFLTSHPKDASRELFDTMARNEKLAKQLHLPFQSGSDRVLRAMNRRYTAGEYLELVEYARSVMPELVLTSDVIVGFPGETEAEFAETLSLVERARCDALFTFIYSPRPGTPAAKLPDPVPREEKIRWFDRLCDLQNRISTEKHAAYVGKTVRVLVDGRESGGALTARTEGGRLVRLEGPDERIGSFAAARITGSGTWSLTGELID